MSAPVTAGFPSIARSPAMRPYLRSMALVRTHGQTSGDRDRKVEDAPIEIEGPVVVQPYTPSASEISTEGERDARYWLMISATQTQIKDSDAVVDRASGQRYAVVVARLFADHYETVLRS